MSIWEGQSSWHNFNIVYIWRRADMPHSVFGYVPAGGDHVTSFR